MAEELNMESIAKKGDVCKVSFMLLENITTGKKFTFESAIIGFPREFQVLEGELLYDNCSHFMFKSNDFYLDSVWE